MRGFENTRKIRTQGWFRPMLEPRGGGGRGQGEQGQRCLWEDVRAER